MTAVADLPLPVQITEPGVYDLPEGDYHADPVPGRSLSSTGARKILPPSCPALFRHEQLHGRPNKSTFDLGHAAHTLVLGTGAPFVVIDAEDWRTKAAREHRDAAYAAGHTPLLKAEHEQVQAMADAILQHPLAAALFNPEHGDAEQSLFWLDPTYDVWRRSRIDFFRNRAGRPLVIDYKTTQSAEPGAIARTVANYGYHQQADFYLDGITALGLADEETAFVFVFQEKTAPYLVTVVQLDAQALRIGRQRNQQALEVYAECKATDTWPGYSSDVELVSLPAWAVYQQEQS